jgi:catechol 2,3-dioxygenase-like lactoylglutathione lyase family enzyme
VPALAYQGITYTSREKLVDLGARTITAQKAKMIPLPPIVGASPSRAESSWSSPRRASRRDGRRTLGPSQSQVDSAALTGDDDHLWSMSSWSIDHISAVTLAVLDMAQSVAFYQKLGLAVTYGGPDAAFTTMRAGQSVINLRHAPTSAGNPWNRVILRVRGVDALYRDLVKEGLAPTEPKDAEWGERYFELSDPQGLVISFAELL